MKTIITIENLKCNGCAHTITTGIEKIEGITLLNVDIPNSSVTIEYSGEKSVLDNVKLKLRTLGYPEKGNNNNIGLKAKSFVSCAIGRINK